MWSQRTSGSINNTGITTVHIVIYFLQIRDLEAHIATKNKLQKTFSKEGVDSGSAHILITSKSSKGKKKK